MSEGSQGTVGIGARRGELVAVLVDDAAAAPRWWSARRSIESLPDEPFHLGHLPLKLNVRVTDAAGAALVVEAAARGVPVMVEVRVGPEALAELLDQLRRIGRVEDRRRAGQPSRFLGRQHRVLLDLLAGGATLTSAAAAIGMSRRTATRRLAEARAASGVGSAVEALIVSPRTRR